LNVLIEIAVIVIGVIVAVEIGVVLMKAILSGNPDHHTQRTPAARIIIYIVCAIVLFAFETLATGVRMPWMIVTLIALIVIGLIVAYSKPRRLSP
jgi:presenilin-like A22 family membrane protease